MIRRKPYHCLAGLLCALCFMVGLGIYPQPVVALDLGGILGKVVKIGGIGFVVKQYGDDIDRFINKLLQQKGIEQQGLTKVVPILRLGSGTAVGAAQVVGPAEQVRKVKAVAELELSISGAGRARALISIAATKVDMSTVKGVGGVGISANIKIPL